MTAALRLPQYLEVRVERPYGIRTIYPECPVSRLFAELLKQKTLTRRDIELIKRLGFEVRVKEIVL